MTDKQNIILKKLFEMYEHNHQLVSPTQLGISLGVEFVKAASYCKPTLNLAVEERMIERVGKGLYKPIG